MPADIETIKASIKKMQSLVRTAQNAALKRASLEILNNLMKKLEEAKIAEQEASRATL
ncbi:MAG: hypothetical protein WBA93_04265 [Microcoleaceae cyanobacterium]